MIKRRKTKIVKAGSVKIGYSAPIVIQSMIKVATTNIGQCIRQINQLAKAGCELVRVAVPTKADTLAFAKIVQKANVPLIGDIHFSPARAIEAIEAGAVKIRLNPGNIKEQRGILRIIDAAKLHKTAIRIGVNEASIRDLRKTDIPEPKRVALMLREIKKYVRLFEKRGFTQIVLSAKSSDTIRTIEINRKIAELFEYPIHIGLTHTGLPEDAQIPSAITLGTLLCEGIGDTIRISIAGNPTAEVEMAKKILTALNVRPRNKPDLKVCPTCGRAQVNVVNLARKVQKVLTGINKPLRIAVMGCVVNGPGEAADADLAVCAAKSKGYIYRQGTKISVVPENKIIPTLLEQLKILLRK
jgi:(E)-4-hydroxy-3-methylbut-2-enyl-diphosphate synthase